METVLTQPSATPVMQALRSLGYNPKTAIADLIDNSIDANATHVILEFQYKKDDGFIMIKDNGIGMDEEELQVAMNIGSKDPRIARKSSELGRFGMGLKTAAFSLGKRLSVLTKKNGYYSERCWDLDYVSEHNEWSLFKEIPKEIKEQMGKIDEDSGTVVFIDKLDRFMGYGTDKVIKDTSFFNKIGQIKNHLELVFHSLLEEKLQISINNNSLVPWNPFLVNHLKITEGERQVFKANNRKFTVKPYVLPHSSNFNELEYKKAGGIKGWRDQQGFYVYRENRLLYFGDWLGLFSKDAASQLTRIRIDLSNESDEEWQVDVKKSNILIPEDAKIPLKKIAENYRNVSREIFYFRTKSSYSGQKIKGGLNTWERSENDEGAFFRLNRTHPLLSELLTKIDKGTSKILNIYLRLVELGSPSNIIDSPKVNDQSIISIEENKKNIIIELANLLIQLDLAKNKGQLINMLLAQPGLEGLNYKTLETILREDKLINE